jgi:peptidoglycan lytic transglycosylase
MSRQRHDFKHLSIPTPPRKPMAGLALSGLSAALVAACSSVPVTTSGPVAPPVERSDGPPPGAKPSAIVPQIKSPTAKRGGAFYKDDGPGDNPPDNLAEVPDATPRLEPLHRFANRPYTVLGQDYVPANALAPYREQGMASWYGRKFHGLNTSSGEPYDMYGMTAAHPTLPIPSYARVTNLANGRSVVVRINDRGPFHKSRVIDLSYTAAFKLGYADAGSTQVEVISILGDELPLVAAGKPVPPLRNRAKPVVVAKAAPAEAPPPVAATPELATAAVAHAEEPLALALVSTPVAKPAPPAAAPVATVGTAAAPAKGAFLQLGVFSTLANAEGFRNHVKEELSWLGSRLELLAENGRYRLHAGPYASAEEAQSTANRIAAVLKLKPFLVWH